MTRRSLARQLLEARLGALLDEIETNPGEPGEDEEGDRIVLDFIALNFEMLGRLVRHIPDPAAREHAERQAAWGFQQNFDRNYRTSPYQQHADWRAN